MEKGIRCEDCLNYVIGYDTKKMCAMNGGMVKVEFPHVPQCKGSGYKGKINLNANYCVDCSHYSMIDNELKCMAVVDVINGNNKTCKEARGNECNGIYWHKAK